MSIMIQKNSMIPIKVKEHFTTHSDNRTEVSFSIYEGENEYVDDNNFLGKFKLK